ncbi:GPW/gp25 family protein [Paenibacillus agricola]|uniref:GPW/gp25 family protein n=1 Tax=Paenibacillus agricola TaxID=2716264 RepID=A0ABX0J8E2_9BACL|nr:GPW/gp25 family protein [Paenibacillus agricola]NHN32417.1 GPW/gp25 family protein [Paenibacillus agricola]
MSEDFLGRGWKFPIQVDKATGRIMMSEYEGDIIEAIRIILGTSLGERTMRPDFGCDVQRFVFGETDATTLMMLGSNVKEAIQIWEPRVHEVEVQALVDSQENGKVNIRIQYMVRSTNNLFNQVYPFYIHEGSK